MANLLGSPFKKYVNDQIVTRQKLFGKKKDLTPNEIQYLNTRNAWVKLASGVNVEQKRLDLLKANGNDLVKGVTPGFDLGIKNVLFNGLSSFGQLDENEIQKMLDLGHFSGKRSVFDNSKFSKKNYYNYNQQQREGISGPNSAYGVGGTEFGPSPMPGIVSVDIKDLNRGSIKKATINIKCHNRAQFDIIDVLYMRLGYTVMLEWGYDKFWNGKKNKLYNIKETLIDKKFFYNQDIDYSIWLPEIERYRKRLQGNYDAMFGTVSNFSWSFNDDGSYDIKVEVMSLGDVIESLKVNLPPLIDVATSNYAGIQLDLIKDELANRQASQDEFYDVLYPGLEDYIDEVWKGAIAHRYEIWDGVEVYEGTRYQQAISSFGKWKPPQPNYNNITDIEGGRELVKQVLNDALISTTYKSNIRSLNYKNYQGNVLLNSFNELLSYNTSYTPNLGGLNNTYGGGNEAVQKGDGWVFIYDGDNVTKYPNTSNTIIPGISGSNSTPQQLYQSTISNINTPIGKDGYLVVPFVAEVGSGYKINLYSNYGYFKPLSIKSSFTNLNYFGGHTQGKSYSSFAELGNGPKFSATYMDLMNSPKGLEIFKEIFYRRFNYKYKGGFFDKRFKSATSGTTQNTTPELQSTIDFAEELNENKNKNKIYEYFYRIRKEYFSLITPNPANKDSKLALKGQELKDWRANSTKLHRQLRIYLEGDGFDNGKELIGHWLNPYSGGTTETDDQKSWNKNVGFPLYKGEKTYFNLTQSWGNKVRNDIWCDFFHLRVNPVKKSYFIRFGTFLEFLQDKVIPRIEGKTPMIKIGTSISSNICYSIDQMISLDINKVLIPNYNFFKGYNSNSPIGEKLFYNTKEFHQVVSAKGLRWGRIMAIYLNMDRIEEIFDGVDENNQINLFDALKSICNDINECLGSVNNIEPVIDKEKNIIKFIDQTPIVGIEEVGTYIPGYSKYKSGKEKQTKLELFGYNNTNNTSNFIHKAGITTQIDKNYATAITIGATSNGAVPGIEATAFSKWNIGLGDRFKNNILDSNAKSKTEPLEKQNENVLKNYRQFTGQQYLKLGLGKSDGVNVHHTINNDAIKSNKNIAQNYYIYAQAETSKQNEDTIESSIGFIPFNLKIDMDGISGIRIYDYVKVNSSFLPSNYGKTLEFICTGVNHKLSNNNWITSLETIATSKSR